MTILKDEVLPEIVISPQAAWSFGGATGLWNYRDLFAFLVWRNIRILYKQTVLGFLWAVLRPLLSMVIFSVVFGRLARLPSDGLPYPLFCYLALVPWSYFSTALTNATGSLVGSAGIITKVYFPRVLLPLASITSGLLDFAIAFALTTPLMLHYGVTPTPALLLVPLPILLMLLTTAGLGLWLSALSVQYRDVRFALPFLVQVLLYAAPVVWPASLVPERFRLWYGLYPMAGVIEGLRAAVTGRIDMPWAMLGMGTLSAMVLFITGLLVFRRMERGFADVI